MPRTNERSKQREWIIDVCRTCGKLAQWPFCIHRPSSYDASNLPWTEPVIVRKVGR